MIQQKKLFLKSEANKFFKRNIERLSQINYKNHKIVIELQKYLCQEGVQLVLDQSICIWMR